MKTPNNRMQARREMREENSLKPTHSPVWPGNDVDFNPAVCPNCGSARNHVVKTFAAIKTSNGEAIQQRHHDCFNCAIRFRSAQRIPASDVAYCRTEG